MIDVCDPLGVAMSGRFIYFVDELNSIFGYTYLMRKKSETFEYVQRISA